jgi:tetratricopeptide (TPR) repeat protein
MSETIAYQQAVILIKQAYRQQMQGRLGEALELYERSLSLHPTAEAHTYIGWTYSMMGRYDDAIEQCELAIEVDPSFGNPYNDIGAYLIELGEWSEAIPWFEKALAAPRYEHPQFALTNLGRVYQRLGRAQTALHYYDEALAKDPLYRVALNAKYVLLGKLN